MNLVNKQVQTALKATEKTASSIKKSLESPTKTPDTKNVAKGYLEQADALFKNVGALNKVEQAFGRGSKEAKLYFESISSESDVAGKKIRALQKATKQMDFGFLSLIFGGMALQRTFGNVFRSIINGYKDFAKQNDVFILKTNKLGASFAFLKFIIGKAFADSPLVQKFISGITKSLDYLGKFFDDHPNLAFTVSLLAGSLFAIGSAMSFAGNLITLKLAYDYIKKITDLGSIKNISKLDGLSTSLSKLNKALRIGGGLLVAGLSVAFVINKLSGPNDFKDRLQTILVGTMGGAIAGGIIGSIFGPTGTLAGIAIGTAIGLVFSFTMSLGDFIFEDKPTLKDFFNTVKQYFSNWTGIGKFLLGASNISFQAPFAIDFFTTFQKTTENRKSNFFDTNRDVLLNSYIEWNNKKKELEDKYIKDSRLFEIKIRKAWDNFKLKDVGPNVQLKDAFGNAATFEEQTSLLNQWGSALDSINKPINEMSNIQVPDSVKSLIGNFINLDPSTVSELPNIIDKTKTNFESLFDLLIERVTDLNTFNDSFIPLFENINQTNLFHIDLARTLTTVVPQAILKTVNSIDSETEAIKRQIRALYELAQAQSALGGNGGSTYSTY